MKRILIIAIVALTLASCKSEPTLQTYFVEKTEDTNFVAVDISPSILQLDQTKLTVEQTQALESFDKMNILAFKAADTDPVLYEAEKNKVKELLKNEKYQELMKFGAKNAGGSLSFVGDDEHIDEFILFANQSDTGFAVVRILGNDMNPTGVMTLMSLLQQSNINSEQLKPLEAIFKK